LRAPEEERTLRDTGTLHLRLKKGGTRLGAAPWGAADETLLRRTSRLGGRGPLSFKEEGHSNELKSVAALKGQKGGLRSRSRGGTQPDAALSARALEEKR